MLLAVGHSASLGYHSGGRYAFTLQLGYEEFTPPPSPPPHPPPSPPCPPPMPKPPMPLPPAPPPSPPPTECPDGASMSSLDPEFACEITPTHGFTLHWRTNRTHVHFKIERSLVGGPVNWGDMDPNADPNKPGSNNWWRANLNHGMVDHHLCQSHGSC